MIKFLCWLKVNSIALKQPLIDMGVSHEELIAVLKEKDKYEKMKENLRTKNEKQETITLSSIKLKT